MSTLPALALNDGHTIPAIGFGTWPLNDTDACAAVGTALDAGYRLIDTATMYKNETGVGRAIRESSVARKDIFLTTKLAGVDHGYEQTLRAFDASVARLGLDQVDLYLIHWPLPQQDRYVGAWRAMIELQRDARVKSIGVSNFQPAHIDRLIEETGVVPAVNQIELHPDFAQVELRRYHAAKQIVTESWSPLGRGNLFDDARLLAIAKKHGVTAAQVALRWHVQLGLVPIPKSKSSTRIAQNLDLSGFSLDTDDLTTLAALDGDNRQGGHPDTHTE